MVGEPDVDPPPEEAGGVTPVAVDVSGEPVPPVSTDPHAARPSARIAPSTPPPE